MIEPLDRSRRDSTLFQFTTKRLRDFIDPNHLLIRIDRQLDFAKLVAPLEDCYCPDFGRPAIHPEVMVRALLIGSVYNIASFRRLCSAISENLAYRWFCFLTISDPVFDHSSISHFIDRIGRDGFATIFEGLNEELFRLGMLSPEMYADASLVKANASSFEMVPSGMTVAEFQELAVEENGLFVLTETSVGDDGVENDEVRHFQDPKGRLPLNPVDTDARWRTSSPKRPAELCYQDNVTVDLGGFIVARGVTHASQGEWKAIPQLLEQLPIHPVSLTMDTGYSAGELRQLLEDRGIKAYIPLRPIQKDSVVGPGGFIYHGDWLVCPQGKELHRRGYNQKEQRYMYTARREDCQACPIRNDCLPPRQKRRYVSLTRYYPMTLLARKGTRPASIAERGLDARLSRKALSLPWTVWDGPEHGCGGCGKSIAKGTWRPSPTMSSRWCASSVTVSGYLIHCRPPMPLPPAQNRSWQADWRVPSLHFTVWYASVAGTSAPNLHDDRTFVSPSTFSTSPLIVVNHVAANSPLQSYFVAPDFDAVANLPMFSD